MKYLLDSNIVIAALLGEHAALRAYMAQCDHDDMALSSIAFAEVAYGSVHGKPPSFDQLSRFVEKIPILPFDHGAARVYAALPFKRASFDRLIAAHALALGVTLITNNLADFADVPGLKVEDWTI